MSILTIPPRPAQRLTRVQRIPQSVPPSVTGVAPVAPGAEPARSYNPHNHGGTVVFEICFRSSMSGSDLELFRGQLGMTTHVEHKLPADPNSPAVAQLDQETSLLLERGPDEGRWVMQARTWGAPSPRTVHEWHVRVAQVIHQLDPAIVSPERMPAEPDRLPVRPVGRATSRPLAALRRRLVGLP